MGEGYSLHSGVYGTVFIKSSFKMADNEFFRCIILTVVHFYCPIVDSVNSAVARVMTREALVACDFSGDVLVGFQEDYPGVLNGDNLADILEAARAKKQQY